ncbi:MAG: hypothetical protein R2729_22080 [Bryobacteraceae bacterium]
MPIIIKEPSETFRNSVVTGSRQAKSVASMTKEDVGTALTPHQIYTIDEDRLAAGATIADARLIGWRVFHADDRDAVIESYCTENDDGHQFGGVNRGPYVAGTRSALAAAKALPEAAEQDFEVRLLRLHALHFTALWLHGSTSETDILIPIAPIFSGHNAGQPYPAAPLLNDLRGLAQELIVSEQGRQ